MGILGIVKKLLHPAKGEVWCLHRVVENRSIFPSNRELEITPDYLEQLIKSYRTKGYQFVKIDDICHSTPLFKKKKINISFDDGFVDIYSTAFPIFKKYDIPFTIFLSTDFPEKKADMW